MGLGGQRHTPAAVLPRKETQYPLYGWLGGPYGRSERARKISPPPGLDTQTAQPVAIQSTNMWNCVSNSHMAIGNVQRLLRKQGPRHTPQMHRSLEAYCATLGPP